MRNSRFDSVFFQRLYDTLLPFAAVLAAFLIGAVLLLLQGVNPIEAYQALFVGAFGSKNGLSDTLVKAIPLMLVGLGIAIAFRGGVINIGAEGQIIVGSLLTTYMCRANGGKLAANFGHCHWHVGWGVYGGRMGSDSRLSESKAGGE